MKVGAHIPRLALGAAREPQEELVEIDLTVAVEVSLGEGPLQLLVSEGRPSTITLQPRQFGRRKARELLLRHLVCMGLQRGCTGWKFHREPSGAQVSSLNAHRVAARMFRWPPGRTGQRHGCTRFELVLRHPSIVVDVDREEESERRENGRLLRLEQAVANRVRVHRAEHSMQRRRALPQLDELGGPPDLHGVLSPLHEAGLAPVGGYESELPLLHLRLQLPHLRRVAGSVHRVAGRASPRAHTPALRGSLR